MLKKIQTGLKLTFCVKTDFVAYKKSSFKLKIFWKIFQVTIFKIKLLNKNITILSSHYAKSLNFIGVHALSRMFKSEENSNNIESMIKVEPEEFQKNIQIKNKRQLPSEILRLKANM